MNTSEFLEALREDPAFDAFGASQPKEWMIEAVMDRCPTKLFVDIWVEARIVCGFHASGDDGRLALALDRFHEACNLFYAAYDEPDMVWELKVNEWLLHEAVTADDPLSSVDGAMRWFDEWVSGFNHAASEAMHDDSYEATKKIFMESSIDPNNDYVDGVAYYHQLVERREKERLQSKQDISISLATELIEEVDELAESQDTSRDTIISDILYRELALA